MECLVALGPSEVLTWSWGFIKNCDETGNCNSWSWIFFNFPGVALRASKVLGGRVSYSWSTTSSIPLLSSAPRQPLNMKDILKISLIIILPFLGSVIRWKVHLGSWQAFKSWWPLHRSIGPQVFDCQIQSNLTNCRFQNRTDGSMTSFVPGWSLKCARLVLDEMDAGAPGKPGM